MKRAQAQSIQAAASKRFGHLGGAGPRAEEVRPDGPWEAKEGDAADQDALPCRTCDGTGDVPDDAGGAEDCPTCDGDGTEPAEECPRCDGDGLEPETDDIDCTKCNGSGKLYESDDAPGAKREAIAFARSMQAAQVKLGRRAAKPARTAPKAARVVPATRSRVAPAKADRAPGPNAEAKAFAAKMDAAMKKVRG